MAACCWRLSGSCWWSRLDANITYRPLTTIADFEAVTDLEIVIWGTSDRDAVPANVLRPMVMNSGVAVGAFIDADMIGMAVGFPAFRDGSAFLWSHITGVHPDFQGLGVGLTLKQYQRQMAVDIGYEQIRWTFDPLQSRNAWFNITRLGATSFLYYENFYGAMNDDLNRGLPSDRIEAVWQLHNSVRQITPEWMKTLPPLVIRLGEEQPVSYHMLPAPGYRIDIPRDVSKLAPNRRLHWRMVVREKLREAFAGNHEIVYFDTRGTYILRQRS